MVCKQRIVGPSNSQFGAIVLPHHSASAVHLAEDLSDMYSSPEKYALAAWHAMGKPKDVTISAVDQWLTEPDGWKFQGCVMRAVLRRIMPNMFPGAVPKVVVGQSSKYPPPTLKSPPLCTPPPR